MGVSVGELAMTPFSKAKFSAWIEEGIILVKWILCEENIADLYTKNLAG
jgi:hypothetical protein